MGSKYIRKHLMPSLMAGMFLFLSACQGTSRDVEGRIAKVGGTGSEGGVQGRVANDKDLQANLKSSNQVLPFLVALVPAFTKLGADKGTSWENYLKLKNWYMGSESLSEKFNGLISITRFDNDSGDQILAHQTQYEVFINSILFDKLAKEKQQSAMLKEFLISLYTMKHLDDAKLCALMKDVYSSTVKECAKHSASSVLDEAKEVSEELPLNGETSGIVSSEDFESRNTTASKQKPTKVLSPREKLIKDKSITGEDINDIQAAMTYLQNLDASNVDTQNVINKLKSLNFDTRIFDYKLGLTVAEGNKSAQTITVEERDMVVSQMKKASAKDLNCSFHGSKVEAKICSLSVESLTIDKAKAKMLSVKIDVDGKKLAEDTILLTDKDGLIQIGYYTDASSKVKYMLIPVASASLPQDQQKEKSLYRGYYIMANIGTAGLEFAGIYSAPGIVTSATAQENGKVLCKGAANFGEETPGIFVSITSKSLSEAFAKNMAPVAPCY
ncbi:hypothetical protein AZI86_04765 [Bdellovibrio bacteriovorus]|uniref:Lipoprotein n=1 Tax=Bdellovibrio bacteriovorus TaxID=959 RepID=A0A150WPE1_BDEBC|nr:hypothetical protein [Bdellovibrio bacteriovorus]KYG66371.1 hypothetical protein AZI86_04765 [Bdellovibrio bacteriovorus]